MINLQLIVKKSNILLLLSNIILLSSLLPLTKSIHQQQEKRVEFKRSYLITTDKSVHQPLFQSDDLLSKQVKELLSEGYHNTTESLSAAINRLVQNYPNLADSFIVGQSIGKNPILGLKLSSKKAESQLSKPAFVLLGGIHGDHAIGHELSLHFAAFLLDNYQLNDRIKNVLDSVDILIIPTLNPDGFQRATEGDCYSAKLNSGRNNLAGIDLDTDFKFHNFQDLSEVLAKNKLQPESKSLLEWIVTKAKSAGLFVTLRTGLTGITYPYDEFVDQITEHTYLSSGASTSSNASPDKPLFEFLAHQVFYKYQPEPTDSKCNPTASNVTVLDGAQMGSTYGTLNDFVYRFTNSFPLNVYLDCCKYPKHELLKEKWTSNANSLFALIESSLMGVSGTVTDLTSNKPISQARISIAGSRKVVSTSNDGRFWRPSIPGIKSDLQIEADGYKTAIQAQVTPAELEPSEGKMKSVSLDVKLHPINEKSSTKSAEEQSTSSETPESALNINNLPAASVLKPATLFKDVDAQISKLDFKTPTDLQKHHNYLEMVDILKSLSRKYPKITRLYDIGTSIEGRKLWALEISSQPGRHQLLRPEFRYIANMHGNEAVGRELTLGLAKLLVENYGSNSLVTALVNSTRIHLLPSMNPDGYEKSSEGDCESELGRANAADADLNRNFPDRYGKTIDNSHRQPEVAAIMNWSKQIPFVLGANLHGGSLVANYPFDGNKNHKNGQYEASPDDKLFVHLAKSYSTNHPTMSRGEHCYDICGDDKTSLLNERFKDGITNGAKWYVLYGGIQDWVYLNTNCLGITVELGCTKFPMAKDLPRYWSDNKKPLIKYMLEAHRGIFGLVTDKNDKLLANATIHVRGVDHDVRSSDFGDYWRLLLPGEYFVSVSKEGYRTAHRTVTVGSDSDPAKRIDFTLRSGPKDLEINTIQGKDQPIAEETAEEEEFSGVVELNANTTSGGSQKAQTNSSLNDVMIVESPDTKYMLALCFIIVMPTIMLLVYLFGVTDIKRNPYRFGFSRLSTGGVGDDFEVDDDDEGTRFMKKSSRGAKFTALANDARNSDSEDELYSVDSWNK